MCVSIERRARRRGGTCELEAQDLRSRKSGGSGTLDLLKLTRCKSARLTPTQQESRISRAESSEQVPPAARSLPNFARLTVSLWEQCGSFSTPGFAPSRVHKLPRRTPSCRSPTCRTPSRPSTTYAYSATVAKSGEQVRLAALTWRLSPTSPGLRDSGAKSGGLTARKSD